MSTLAILYYTLVVPISMLLAILYLLHNKYSHKTFEPWEPDVLTNLDFVKENIELTIQTKLLLEKFRAEILCWGNQEVVNKILNGLIMGTIGSFFVF